MPDDLRSVAAGGEIEFNLRLYHEADTTGQLSGDLQLHTPTYSGRGDSNTDERSISLVGGARGLRSGRRTASRPTRVSPVARSTRRTSWSLWRRVRSGAGRSFTACIRPGNDRDPSPYGSDRILTDRRFRLNVSASWGAGPRSAGRAGKVVDSRGPSQYARRVLTRSAKLVLLLVLLPQLMLFGGGTRLSLCLGGGHANCADVQIEDCRATCSHDDGAAPGDTPADHDEHCGCTDLDLGLSEPVLISRGASEDLPDISVESTGARVSVQREIDRGVARPPSASRRASGPATMAVSAGVIRSTRLLL